MGYITNYQYYENGGVSPTSANHGSYQYLPLSVIVDNYMLHYIGEDKVVDNVRRDTVIFHTKAAIRELNYDAVKSYSAIEVEIGTDLKMILPHDYINWVRISMEKEGVLFPLVQNNSTMSADAYLLDNNDNLTFDGSGEVLLTSSELDAERLAATATFDQSSDCTQYSFGANYGLETNDSNRNPRFEINARKGVINFDSRISGELIVLEYVSDGMANGDDSEIEIGKFFEQYVYAFISRELLENKVNISDVVIRRAKKKASALLSNAKIRSSDLSPARLLQVFRGQSKWIK